MTTEVDLLNTIHEYADMGLSGLNQVIPLSSDPSFTRELQHQKSDYEAALQKSEALLEERHIPRGKEAGPVAKMMSTVMTRAKNLADPSTSKLAEMVFQGSNMGITELTKGINDYHGEDKAVLSFAEKQLKQDLETLRDKRWKEGGFFPKQEGLTVAYQVERNDETFSAALTEEHFQLSTDRVDSTDAYVEYNSDQSAYVIVPETLGNHMDQAAVEAYVEEQIRPQIEGDFPKTGLNVEITSDLYRKAAVTQDAQELQEKVTTLNAALQKYKGVSVTYTFGKETQVLDNLFSATFFKFITFRI